MPIIENLIWVDFARDEATKKIRSYKNKKSVEKVIAYVMRENKRKYVSGFGVLTKSGADCVSADFMTLKKEAGKMDGRQLYHLIVSFADVKNPEVVFDIVKKVCRILLTDMQYVFAVHTNTNHLHAHIVVNSVTLKKNFLKIHFSKKEGEKFLGSFRQLCLENLDPKERNSLW